MTQYVICIGKAAAHERDTEICAICGRPATIYGQIEDTCFYFCDDHEHLATEANLIAEHEILTEQDDHD